MTLLALALLAGAPLAARPAPAASAAPVQTDADIDAALQRLQAAARERGATRELYERWRDMLIARARAGHQANPATPDYTGRLQAMAEDLDARVRESKAADADFGRARAVTLEARIDWAVAEIQRAVLAGRIAREDYDRALALLRQRLEAARAVNAQTPYRVEPIEVALNEIRGTTERTEELTRRQFALLQEQILRTRLESALADLEREARARRATRALYDRWRNVLVDWAAAAAPQWPDATRVRDDLRTRIDAIEKAQLAGEDVSEMFASLHESFTRAAREAAAHR